MDDVASVHSENLNLRKIQQKLLQWEKKECSLSHLTQYQIDVIDQLNECSQQKSVNSTSELVSCNQISTIGCEHLKYNVVCHFYSLSMH